VEMIFKSTHQKPGSSGDKLAWSELSKGKWTRSKVSADTIYDESGERQPELPTRSFRRSSLIPRAILTTS